LTLIRGRRSRVLLVFAAVEVVGVGAVGPVAVPAMWPAEGAGVLEYAVFVFVMAVGAVSLPVIVLAALSRPFLEFGERGFRYRPGPAVARSLSWEELREVTVFCDERGGATRISLVALRGRRGAAVPVILDLRAFAVDGERLRAEFAGSGREGLAVRVA